MTNLLKTYYAIMNNYRAGGYGEDDLYYAEIFERAGEPDLFKRMSVEDIEYLLNDAKCGLLRTMFRGLLRAAKKREAAAAPPPPPPQRQQQDGASRGAAGASGS
jgi:hypothetical protein